VAKEYIIDAGMVFRKMYCHHCGTQLKKEQISKTNVRGEEGFSPRVASMIVLDRKVTRVRYVYKCPKCQAVVDYQTQKNIARKQKLFGSKILTDEQVEVFEPKLLGKLDK